MVSVLLNPEPEPPWRLVLQALQRLGSFLKFLSWKKCCSPAVNTKSAPQSTHLRTRSWNSDMALALCQPELLRILAGLAPRHPLFDLPARFLPVSLAGQRLLGPALLTRLQIEGMAFDLFNNVFLLHLPLKAAKGILQSLALLKLHFSQTKYTSQLDLKFRAGREIRRKPLACAESPQNSLRLAQKVLIS